MNITCAKNFELFVYKKISSSDAGFGMYSRGPGVGNTYTTYKTHAMRFPSPGFMDSSVRVYANEKTNQYLTGTPLCCINFHFTTRWLSMRAGYPSGDSARQGSVHTVPPAGMAKIDQLCQTKSTSKCSGLCMWIDAELYVS